MEDKPWLEVVNPIERRLSPLIIEDIRGWMCHHHKPFDGFYPRTKPIVWSLHPGARHYLKRNLSNNQILIGISYMPHLLFSRLSVTLESDLMNPKKILL